VKEGEVSKVEAILGYSFDNLPLLRRALTLSSASAVNNERLEFLGDAVLQLVVSEKLFSDDKGQTEGQLTAKRQKLVSAHSLEYVVENLGLDKYLIKGAGDNNNRKSVSSVYEALVAAIYLDGGMEAARTFILKTADFAGEYAEENVMGQLQELRQGCGKPLPVYKCTSVGTPERPHFTATVHIDDQVFAGEGASKKTARKNAATAALNFLKEQETP
jgi:ribonuclease-3